MSSIKLAAVALLASLTVPAMAGVYKSIGPNGVIEFSDVPPEKDRLGELILIPEETMREADAAVQRASTLVDLAEHALAVARRPVWTQPDLRITPGRMSLADVGRVEFYKKNVLAARQMLMQVLAQMRRATVPETQTASLAD